MALLGAPVMSKDINPYCRNLSVSPPRSKAARSPRQKTKVYSRHLSLTVTNSQGQAYRPGRREMKAGFFRKRSISTPESPEMNRLKLAEKRLELLTKHSQVKLHNGTVNGYKSAQAIGPQRSPPLARSEWGSIVHRRQPVSTASPLATETDQTENDSNDSSQSSLSTSNLSTPAANHVRQSTPPTEHRRRIASDCLHDKPPDLRRLLAYKRLLEYEENDDLNQKSAAEGGAYRKRSVSETYLTPQQRRRALLEKRRKQKKPSSNESEESESNNSGGSSNPLHKIWRRFQKLKIKASSSPVA